MLYRMPSLEAKSLYALLEDVVGVMHTGVTPCSHRGNRPTISLEPLENSWDYCSWFLPFSVFAYRILIGKRCIFQSFWLILELKNAFNTTLQHSRGSCDYSHQQLKMHDVIVDILLECWETPWTTAISLSKPRLPDFAVVSTQLFFSYMASRFMKICPFRISSSIACDIYWTQGGNWSQSDCWI